MNIKIVCICRLTIYLNTTGYELIGDASHVLTQLVGRIVKLITMFGREVAARNWDAKVVLFCEICHNEFLALWSRINI